MSWVELQDTGLVRVRGPDARTFLQGQITSDVLATQAERSSLGAFATAQGRIAALARVLTIEDSLLLALPRKSEAQALQDRLARHVLRAKVELCDESEAWWAIGLLDSDGVAALAAGADLLPRRAAAVTRIGDLVVIGLEAPRLAVLAPRAAIATLITAFPDAASPSARWRLEEIRSGRPEVVAETRELFVAQALNLDLLGAVSFRKGCYTGQEIIARTQHLGRISRRMARARVDSAPPPPGTPVLARGEITGHVVSAESDERGGCELLVTLSVADRHESLYIGDGPALERLPLPYPVPELDAA